MQNESPMMTSRDAVAPPVRRALIPCGGKGTRMLSITHGTAKELIPVAGRAALTWVIAECAASGIEELLIVISPEKQAIVDAVAPLAGQTGAPRRIEFAVQEEPRGLADAIRHGRDFAGDDPLAVALPDNIFIGAAPGLAEVIETFEAIGSSAVAIVEISAEEGARRGPTAIYDGTLDGDVFRIAKIPSKGDKKSVFDTKGAASAFTGVGRYVFTLEVWPTIDEVARTLAPGAELDDIPVMQSLLARNRLVGRRMRGRFLDIGLPQGYEEANALLSSDV
ncbi:MAG: sugar phosphate nucleotidyltransferase [Gemmatimonadota bacterium]|nr:sugar phosphate nucleotidyltransferase [Gemmatimonadota bacterium]